MSTLILNVQSQWTDQLAVHVYTIRAVKDLSQSKKMQL
jgi:hypothetical protein